MIFKLDCSQIGIYMLFDQLSPGFSLKIKFQQENLVWAPVIQWMGLCSHWLLSWDWALATEPAWCRDTHSGRVPNSIILYSHYKEINPHLFMGHFLLGSILPFSQNRVFFVLTIKNTPKEWNDDEVNNLIEQINQFLTSLIGGINPTNLWYSGTPPCVT